MAQAASQMSIESSHLRGRAAARNREVEWHSGLEVDDELKLSRLLDGQIDRIGPSEYLVDVGGGASALVIEVYRIGHEPTDLHKLSMAPHCRYPIFGG